MNHSEFFTLLGFEAHRIKPLKALLLKLIERLITAIHRLRHLKNKDNNYLN